MTTLGETPSARLELKVLDAEFTASDPDMVGVTPTVRGVLLAGAAAEAGNQVGRLFVSTALHYC